MTPPAAKLTVVERPQPTPGASLLEGALWALLAAATLAVGSVHPWAYQPLWLCSVVVALLALRVLRHHHRQPRLRRPRLPLLWPGLAFLAWSLLGLVPGLPWHTLSDGRTLRGAAFLGSALLVHGAAAILFVEARSRARVVPFLAVLGTVVGLLGLASRAAGSTRPYGVLQPLDADVGAVYTPFVNRNHFAGFMLMVLPACLALLHDCWSRYAERVGRRVSLRRWLIELQTPEGTEALYAALPALVTVAGLLASTSRGAILALAGALLLAALARVRGGKVVIALGVLVPIVLSWLGSEQLTGRFEALAPQSAGRLAIWRESAGRMDGRWWTGHGLNTFALAVSTAEPWALPQGATPWPEGYPPRQGFRSPASEPSTKYYREAHNDYLQVLVETGWPGLALALWAAGAALQAARAEGWLLLAVAAPLLHELVDFDLQIPALSLLFVTLAARGAASGPDRPPPAPPAA